MAAPCWPAVWCFTMPQLYPYAMACVGICRERRAFSVQCDENLGITHVHGSLLGRWRPLVGPPFGALPCHSYTHMPWRASGYAANGALFRCSALAGVIMDRYATHPRGPDPPDPRPRIRVRAASQPGPRPRPHFTSGRSVWTSSNCSNPPSSPWSRALRTGCPSRRPVT